MKCSGPRMLIVLLAGIAVLAVRAPADEEEKSKPKTLKGAKQIGEGRHPCIAPDGNQFAFVRFTHDKNKVDYRGDPIPIPRLYFQAVKKKKASKRSLKSIPQGWTGADAVGVAAGHVVVAKSGKRRKACASLPDKLEVRRVAWSRDGSKLVYIADDQFYSVNPGVKPPSGIERTLYLVDAAGAVKPLALGHSIKSDNCSILSWSPDGKRVAFSLQFFLDGQLPVRRIGVVDVENDRTTMVMQGSSRGRRDWILSGGCEGGHKGEGGFRENTPGVSRRGSPSCSCGAHEMWDEDGNLFTFVVRSEEEAWDAYVATADGQTSYRITDDGRMKWSASLDGEGRRIAFWVAEDGKSSAKPDDCHIEIRDLYSDEVLIVPSPSGAGVGSAICWVPGKSELLFEWVSDDEGTFWLQKVPKPKKVADDAEIRTAGG